MLLAGARFYTVNLLLFLCGSCPLEFPTSCTVPSHWCHVVNELHVIPYLLLCTYLHFLTLSPLLWFYLAIGIIKGTVSRNTAPSAPAPHSDRWPHRPTSPEIKVARHCSRAVLTVGRCGRRRRWVLAYKRRCRQCGCRGRLLMCQQSYSRIRSRGRY